MEYINNNQITLELLDQMIKNKIKFDYMNIKLSGVPDSIKTLLQDFTDKQLEYKNRIMGLEESIEMDQNLINSMVEKNV